MEGSLQGHCWPPIQKWTPDTTHEACLSVPRCSCYHGVPRRDKKMPLLTKTRLRGGGGEKRGNMPGIEAHQSSPVGVQSLGEGVFPVHPLSTFKMV